MEWFTSLDPAAQTAVLAAAAAAAGAEARTWFEFKRAAVS